MFCEGNSQKKVNIYQGQERQNELNLNWDSFKWRNYDYALGRFMSVDPLAEKYPYNSTYAFQENKMGMGRELEGLELITWDDVKDAGEYVGNVLEGAWDSLNESANNISEKVGDIIYASARDFGNYSAGYIAGVNNLRWGENIYTKG